MNRALIVALADKGKEAKLRSICMSLKRIGSSKDWQGNKIDYLDMVHYGINGHTPLSRIADLLNIP